MKGELPASPHVMYSYLNRGASWATILAELIDNAYDQAGGNANSVNIELGDGYVSVIDLGRGIADINMLGTIGASDSYLKAGNIGQFGVGSKSWLCKANRLAVRTVRDGRLHSHTFNAKPIRRAAERHQEIKHWLRSYDAEGTPTSESSCSEIVLSDLVRDAGAIVVPALITDFQKRYWPGLREGRTLTITDKRKRPTVIHSVKALRPPEWTDRLSFESSVDGRAYKAQLGILTANSIGGYSGLFIGYLFRNICVEKQLTTRALPSRIHGQIELSEAWRGAFSNYKNDIVDGKRALLADIEQKAATVLNLANEYSENIRLENIASIVDGNLNDSLRRVTIGDYAKLAIQQRSTKKQRKHKGRAIVKKARQTKAKRRPKQLTLVPTQPQHKQKPITGIRLVWENLGRDTIGEVVFGSPITVKLNPTCPKIDALTKQPRYPGLYLMIGYEISMGCLDLSAFEIERYFGDLLGATKGTEDVGSMARAVKAWFGFVANEAEAEAVQSTETTAKGEA